MRRGNEARRAPLEAEKRTRPRRLRPAGARKAGSWQLPLRVEPALLLGLGPALVLLLGVALGLVLEDPLGLLLGEPAGLELAAALGPASVVLLPDLVLGELALAERLAQRLWGV